MGKPNSLKIACASVIALGLFTGAAMAQTPLRIAVETSPGDPLNLMLTTFKDELAANAGADFAVEFFEGGSLGDETALTEMLRVDRVQVVPLGSDIVQMDHHFAVFDAPFLFDNKDEARAALDGELGELLKTTLRQRANLHALAFGELGFRSVSNNPRPINVPADLAGLKIRTPGSETRILAFTMLGAAPTPMALGDAYVAMRQGALDGQENPLSVIEEFSLYEVQKYISLTNHVYSPITLTMNGKTWDALSDDQKAKVTAAAEVAGQKTRELSDSKDAELVAFFESKGVAVNTPDIAAFQAAAEPIHAEIAKFVTPEFMAQVEAIVK